jgi:hypothetical protein
MGDEDSKEQELGKTLLGSVPPTDPAIIYHTEEQLAERMHYAAIGRVASYWSFFEVIVDMWSMRLAGIHYRRGLCLAQISGIGRKLDAFISLARLRDLPLGVPDKLNKFAESAQGLSEKRNRLVHDVWFLSV